jgi:hypothetical protein
MASQRRELAPIHLRFTAPTPRRRWMGGRFRATMHSGRMEPAPPAVGSGLRLGSGGEGCFPF